MKKDVDQAWFDQNWFSELTAGHKLAWFFVWTKSDLAGVWNPNFKLANFQLGANVNWDKFLEAVKDKITVLPNGNWWIKDYCKFQFGNFSPDSRVHQAVKKCLNNHGIEDKDTLWIAYPYATDSIIVGSGNGQGQKQGQGEEGMQGEKQTKKSKKGLALPETVLLLPDYQTPEFQKAWQGFYEFRSESKEPLTQRAVELIAEKLLEWGEQKSIEALNQSVISRWTGIHPPKVIPLNHKPQPKTHEERFQNGKW